MGNGAATELNAGGLDAYALAKMFPTAMAFCDWVAIAPGGTHSGEGSPKDEWFRCGAAAQAGESLPVVMTAVLATGIAGAAVVAWVAMDRARDSDGNPPPGPKPPPPPGEPAPPVPHPLPPAFRAPDVAAVVATNTEIRTLAEECLGRIADADTLWTPPSEEDCETLPIFVTGTNAPAAADHDLEVLAQRPGLIRLNYEDPDTKAGRGTWYEAIPPCPDSSATLHCDEFPFFSTEQGGPLAELEPGLERPSLELIAASDNLSQGGSLRWFYDKCNMRTGTPRAGRNATGGTCTLRSRCRTSC